MKFTIFFAFLFLLCNTIQSQNKDGINLQNKNNSISQSSTTSFSLGLVKEFSTLIYKKENPLKLNLGFHFFFKSKSGNGIVTGIDANKSLENSTLVTLSVMPHYKVLTEDGFNLYLGFGGVLGFASGHGENSGIKAGYILSFRTEKDIDKKTAFLFNIKVPHFISSLYEHNVNLIFTVGVVLK